MFSCLQLVCQSLHGVRGLEGLLVSTATLMDDIVHCSEDVMPALVLVWRLE